MTRPIKAVRIDPAARLISFVTLAVEPTGWEGPITAELACSDAVRIGIDQQRSVWFDDAALHRPWAQQSFFAIDGNTLAGAALVINHDSDGVPCNVGITLKALRACVTWIDPQDVRIDAPSFIYEKGGKIVTEYLGGQPFFTFDHQPGDSAKKTSPATVGSIKAEVEAAHVSTHYDFALLPEAEPVSPRQGGFLEGRQNLNAGGKEEWPGVVAKQRSKRSDESGEIEHTFIFQVKNGKRGRPVTGLDGERFEQKELTAAKARFVASFPTIDAARNASNLANVDRGESTRDRVLKAAQSITNPKKRSIGAVHAKLPDLSRTTIGDHRRALIEGGKWPLE